MQDYNYIDPLAPKRTPWNKGKLTGAKPPLRPKHVWAIRTKLQVEGRKRDLALFNLAVDSKLRGCDVVSIRVEDIAPRGYAVDRASVRQKKTGRPVKFELTDLTRQALDDYLKATGRQTGQFLFAGRGRSDRNMTTRHAVCQERKSELRRHYEGFGFRANKRTMSNVTSMGLGSISNDAGILCALGPMRIVSRTAAGASSVRRTSRAVVGGPIRLATASSYRLSLASC
jgi:hypothetical protein